MRNQTSMAMTVATMTVVAVCAQAAQTNETNPYATMAPLERYLIPEQAKEIALARTAAPASISGEATIYVLTRRGYERAIEGKNGFACIVARSWDAPFADREFWNPRLRAPICYNPAAAQTELTEFLKRTELVLAGRSRDEIMQAILGAYRSGELRAPTVGAMSYMMSKDHYLTDNNPKFQPHLMFYTPASIDAAAWGANLAQSPVLMGPGKLPDGSTAPVNVFVVPVQHWSDGTAADAGTHTH